MEGDNVAVDEVEAEDVGEGEVEDDEIEDAAATPHTFCASLRSRNAHGHLGHLT